LKKKIKIIENKEICEIVINNKNSNILKVLFYTEYSREISKNISAEMKACKKIFRLPRWKPGCFPPGNLIAHTSGRNPSGTRIQN
jgi:hypothetical protein